MWLYLDTHTRTSLCGRFHQALPHVLHQLRLLWSRSMIHTLFSPIVDHLEAGDHQAVTTRTSHTASPTTSTVPPVGTPTSKSGSFLCQCVISCACQCVMLCDCHCVMSCACQCVISRACHCVMLCACHCVISCVSLFHVMLCASCCVYVSVPCHVPVSVSCHVPVTLCHVVSCAQNFSYWLKHVN